MKLILLTTLTQKRSVQTLQMPWANLSSSRAHTHLPLLKMLQNTEPTRPKQMTLKIPKTPEQQFPSHSSLLPTISLHQMHATAYPLDVPQMLPAETKSSVCSIFSCGCWKSILPEILYNRPELQTTLTNRPHSVVYALKRYCNEVTAYTTAAEKKCFLSSMVKYTARDAGERLTEFATLVNHSTYSKKIEVYEINCGWHPSKFV